MRTLPTLASLSILCSFLGCGGGENEETTTVPNTDGPTAEAPAATPEEAPATALAALDLSEAGIKASIQAPEGATAADSYGTAEVKVGDGSSFYLEINSGAPDMAELIQEWKDNTMQKLKTTHVETDDVLIVETDAYGTISFWLDASVSVGDEAYHCRSGRGAPSFNRAQIDGFLTACQALSAL
jgi:hypothetical protein